MVRPYTHWLGEAGRKLHPGVGRVGLWETCRRSVGVGTDGRAAHVTPEADQVPSLDFNPVHFVLNGLIAAVVVGEVPLGEFDSGLTPLIDE